MMHNTNKIVVLVLSFLNLQYIQAQETYIKKLRINCIFRSN